MLAALATNNLYYKLKRAQQPCVWLSLFCFTTKTLLLS